MLAEIKNPVLRFVVNGHVVLALGAAAQLWWVNEFLYLYAEKRLVGFVALATFAAYGTMRLMRMNVAELAGSPTMVWYRRHARIMSILVGASAVGAGLIGWPMRSTIGHALWLPALLAAFYVLPLGITGGHAIGLRRIPFLKAFIIAFVWASATVILPGTSEREGTPFTSVDVWWFMSIWFGFILSIAIVFDIRDLPYDPPSLRTFPQVFGQRRAKAIAILALLPMLVMLLTMVALAYYPIETGWREPGIDWGILLPAIGLLFTGALIVLADQDRPWWYWALLLDGQLILLPFLFRIGGLL